MLGTTSTSIQRWTRTGYTYAQAGGEGSAGALLSIPGTLVTLSDAPIEDAASEQFFAGFTNWYGSSYACRVCGSQLFKSVFPKGGEFEILTDDRAHPNIAIKRVFSCAQCQRFVTSGASEDDVRQIFVHEMPEGRIAVGGHLREPNNFEYECGSLPEYRALVSTTDAAGSTLGRDGAGFVDVGGQVAGLSSDDNESLDTDRLWNLGVEACDAGNLADARSWFSRAAELGDADSMKQLAVLAAQAGDRVTALDWLRDAADHGDAESLHQLGNVAYGEGDLVFARNCYWRAAHLGYAAAMNDFGWLADKEGDRATAVAWYERAAERGDTASMYALGGLAMARGDRTAALTWLERAAELGEPHAIKALQDLRTSMPPGTGSRTTTNDAAGNASAHRAPGSSTRSATTGDQKGGCYVATSAAGRIPAYNDLPSPSVPATHRPAFSGRLPSSRTSVSGAESARSAPEGLNEGATPDPGYYLDPQNSARERWWDGRKWVGQTRPAAPGATTLPVRDVPHVGQAPVRRQGEIAKPKGGCYVATAVYGSYDCPEVWVLRRWRDNHLATTSSGRQFIRFYYRVSPTVVQAVGNERWFSRAVRRPLDRFVARLRASGYSSLPYSDEEPSSRGGPHEVRTPFASRVVAGSLDANDRIEVQVTAGPKSLEPI